MPGACVRRYAEPVPVSEALAAALLQRMRRLNRAERGVLLGAAVIGRRFRLAVLSAATALEEARVREALDKVCALQLVVRESASGDWYAFRHALIRDVAYGTVRRDARTSDTPADRSRASAHGAGAEGISLDDLAYHSWLARDAVRGRRYNEMAGDRAVATFADTEARVYYTRAREFAIQGSEQYRRLSSKLVDLNEEG